MLGNKEVMAKNIQFYMDKFEKTRNDVCNDLGFKYSTFSDWINGKKYPRIDKIEMMANYFHISKSDLVEERLPVPPSPVSLRPDETVLLQQYNLLNESGKEKAQEYISDLAGNQKYTESKKEQSSSPSAAG